MCLMKFFRNGSDYDYYFLLKELPSKFEGKCECFGGKQKSTRRKDKKKSYEKMKKKLQKLIKKEMRILQSFLTKYNLLIVQDLRQVHYRNFSIILQKEFTKTNINIVIVFLNISVKDNLIKYKRLSCNKDYSNKFDEN